MKEVIWICPLCGFPVNVYYVGIGFNHLRYECSAKCGYKHDVGPEPYYEKKMAPRDDNE